MKSRKIHFKHVAEGLVNLFDVMHGLLAVSAQEEQPDSKHIASAERVYNKTTSVMETLCKSSWVTTKLYMKTSGAEVTERHLNRAQDSFCEFGNGDRLDRIKRDQILLTHFIDTLKTTKRDMNKVFKKVRKACKKGKKGQ